jgi:hypothetical protein
MGERDRHVGFLLHRLGHRESSAIPDEAGDSLRGARQETGQGAPRRAIGDAVLVFAQRFALAHSVQATHKLAAGQSMVPDAAAVVPLHDPRGRGLPAMG